MGELTNIFTSSVDESEKNISELFKDNSDINYGDDFIKILDLTNLRKVGELINSVKIKRYAQIDAEMDLSWVKKKDYRIIKTKRELIDCVKEMQRYTYIGFDTETTGVNFCRIKHDNSSKDRLVGLCISWKKDQGIYIPIDHEYITNLPLKFVLKALQPILEKKSLVTHNGIFDAKVMYDLGIILNIVHDTMYLRFDIDGDIFRGTRKLKGLVQEWLNYTPVEFEDIFEYEKDYRLFRYVDEDVARIYACADADHTLQLLPILLKELQPWQMAGYKKHIALILPIMRSEYEGKYIDTEMLLKLNAINDKDLKMVEELIYRYVGIELAYRDTGKFDKEIYKFKITSGPELANVMFNKLYYPRPDSKSGEVKNTINKSVLKFWTNSKEDTNFTKAAEDLFGDNLISDSINHPELHYSKKEHILLSKDKFVNTKYRLALLIQLYRKLYKNKTSFFSNLIQSNNEGKLFTSVNMARAATYRLLDTIQTLDSKLKKIVAPPSGWYQIAADYAQIEARDVTGFSGDAEMAEQLDHVEADYHRIAAAKILKILPEDVSDAERKRFKPVNFGIIYGLGAKGMLDQTDGIGLDEETYKKRLKETKDTIEEWKIGMHLVQEKLDECRHIACTPIPENEVPYTLRGHKCGRVKSAGGRCRYFNLDNLNSSKIASIERKAGNFPIQSHAFDIFSEGVINFFTRLKEADLIDIKVPDDYSPLGYHFESKVIVMAYIHDEMEIIADREINPKWLLKTLYKSMVLKLKGYPTFYIGGGIVKNWYEAKSGDHELPIPMFQMISDDEPLYKRYTDDNQEIIDNEILDYIKKRCIEEFNTIGIDITTCRRLTNKNLLDIKSYYIKSKICDLFKPSRAVDFKNKNYNDLLVSCIETMFGNTIAMEIVSIKNETPIVNDDKDYSESFIAFGDLDDDDMEEEEYANAV